MHRMISKQGWQKEGRERIAQLLQNLYISCEAMTKMQVK